MVTPGLVGGSVEAVAGAGTRRPLWSTRRRSARAATSGLWVMISSVRPVACSRAKKSRTSEPEAASDPAVEQGRGHVLERGGACEQVEALEHEADATVADLGAARVAEVADVQAGELVDAGVGLVEQPEDVEQGGLARAGRAQDRHPLARADLEVDAVQDGHGHLPAAVGAGQAPGAQDRRAHQAGC